jgi:hypothetical protein
VYEPLCNTWTSYDPVWWNTLDFAIRQAWLLTDYDEKRRELKYLYRKLTKERFSGAISRIFGLNVLPVWLEVFTHHALMLMIVALVGGTVMPVLWPIAYKINWTALLNLFHGLYFDWAEVAKEVESAVPQLHGLDDE